jgi:phosphatidylserine/phosphatidylglycerophosphate/cardiolipin synthase-like enzyme
MSVTAAPAFPTEATVYFSPNGGATAAIVRAPESAQRTIVVQAYSFTSAPIAKALLAAHERGVKIVVVLDKSNQTDTYSAVTFLANASIPVLIDAEHATAHNKIMVIDDATVITGSFNSPKPQSTPTPRTSSS